MEPAPLKRQFFFGFLFLFALVDPLLIVADERLDFNRDIRPILADKCFACHGPDEAQRQSDLRLDQESEAVADLGGYSAIVPGSVAESLLAVRIHDEEAPMPPADHPKQLSDSEKSLLLTWIEQGAEWKEHWAYELPVASLSPVEKSVHPNRNFIDAYVSRKMREAGIDPAGDADPRTQIRRLYFDLIGLPPKYENVQDFDGSDRSYQRVVEELLSSPQFGERMAMYWLDLVRYADTVGYHGDQDVSVSPFRDYIIRSFNVNKPFDVFTREQLAGDLLPGPTQEQLVASGYNKLGMMSAEGGVQPEEYLTKYAADRVRNASTVWLGSTLGCAECHDHKFDPFSAKDFYRFAAFFADIKERGLYSGANRDGNWGPSIQVKDPVLAKTRLPLDKRIAMLKESLYEPSAELQKAQQEWERQQRKSIQSWQVLDFESVSAEGGTELKVLDDRSLLATKKNPSKNTYRLVSKFNESVAALKIEVLPHGSLPHSGPGRAGNGNFVISEVRLNRVLEDGSHEAVAFANAQADHEQADGKSNPYNGWLAKATIDGDAKGEKWGWAVLPEIAKPHVLWLELNEVSKAGKYEIVIEQNHDNPKHTHGSLSSVCSNRENCPRAVLIQSSPG